MLAWLASTCKEKALFGFVLAWPGSDAIAKPLADQCKDTCDVLWIYAFLAGCPVAGPAAFVCLAGDRHCAHFLLGSAPCGAP